MGPVPSFRLKKGKMRPPELSISLSVHLSYPTYVYLGRSLHPKEISVPGTYNSRSFCVHLCLTRSVRDKVQRRPSLYSCFTVKGSGEIRVYFCDFFFFGLDFFSLRINPRPRISKIPSLRGIVGLGVPWVMRVHGLTSFWS